MYLNVTLNDGTVHQWPIDASTTLTLMSVDGVNGTVVKSCSDVAHVETVEATYTATVAPEPQPVAADGSPIPVPAVEPPADTSDPAQSSAPAPDPTPVVQQAGIIASDPTIAVDDKTAHLAQAISDVDAAISTWPDSAELVDAKAQLEAMQTALSA